MYIVFSILIALKNTIKFYLRNVLAVCAPRQGWLHRFSAIDALGTNVISFPRVFRNFYLYNKALHCKLARLNNMSLQEYLTSDCSTGKIKFSFIGASKCNGNPGSDLNRFLTTLIENTSNIDEVEVVVCIENDFNEFVYYSLIKERFIKKVNIRFVINHKGIKYPELNKLKSVCIDFISQSTQMVITFTDDCQIIKKNWDVYINNFIPRHSNYYFVNVTSRNWPNTNIPHDEDFVILCDLLLGGPISALTGMSIPVLKIMIEFSKSNPGWTPFGNSFLCDNFFHMLQRYIYQVTKEKLVAFSMIEIKHDIIPGYKNFNQYTFFSPLMREMWPKFISKNHQALVKQLAMEIVKCRKQEEDAIKNNKLNERIDTSYNTVDA